MVTISQRWPMSLFIREEFSLMVGKGKWVVLPYLVAKELQGMRLNKLGVKGLRDRWIRWIVDYS